MSYKLYHVSINSCIKNPDIVDKAKNAFEKFTNVPTNYMSVRRTKKGFSAKIYKSQAKAFLKYLKPTLSPENFDEYGNCTIGYKDYTLLPNANYNLDIPLFGFSVNILIQRYGYSRSCRRRNPAKVKKIDKKEVYSLLASII